MAYIHSVFTQCLIFRCKHQDLFFTVTSSRCLLKMCDNHVISCCSMIGAEFAAASIVVTFSVLLGLTTPLQLLVIALVECVCYSVAESLNLQLLQAQDPGGSVQIHVFATYFGLTVSVLLNRRRGKTVAVANNSSTHLTNIMVMLGE